MKSKSLLANFLGHLPHVQDMVKETESEVSKVAEAELAAHPEASKEAVEADVVAKADVIIGAAASRVPGIAFILPFLMGYFNHLIQQGVGAIYDAVKSKLDAAAGVPASAV